MPEKPWQFGALIEDWLHFQDLNNKAFEFLQHTNKADMTISEDTNHTSSLSNTEIYLKHRDDISDADITPERIEAAKGALKYFSMILEKVLFIVEDPNHPHRLDYIRWIGNNRFALNKFYEYLNKYYKQQVEIDKFSKKIEARFQKFFIDQSRVFESKFNEYRQVVRKLVEQEDPVPKKHFRQLLGTWDVTNSIFNQKGYPAHLMSLFKFIVDNEAYVLLNKPFEENGTEIGSVMEIILRDYYKAREWYKEEKIESIDATYGDKLFSDLNVAIHHINQAITLNPTNLQNANDQFINAVQLYSAYKQQSLYRKALYLLNKYGPSMWEKIKNDAFDIGKDILSAIKLPVHVLRAVCYTLPSVIVKMTRSSDYRQSLMKNFKDGIGSIKNGIVNFLHFIKETAVAFPRVFTKEAWSNLLPSLKEQFEKLILWTYMHPLKALLWVVLGVGIGVGTHFLAPLIGTAIVGGVVTSGLADAILGIRIASQFTNAIIEFNNIPNELEVRIATLDMLDPDKAKRQQYYLALGLGKTDIYETKDNREEVNSDLSESNSDDILSSFENNDDYQPDEDEPTVTSNSENDKLLETLDHLKVKEDKIQKVMASRASEIESREKQVRQTALIFANAKKPEPYLEEDLIFSID